MKEYGISRKYARALFREGKEKGILPGLKEDLTALLKAIEQEPGLGKILLTRAVAPDAKKKMVRNLKVSPSLTRFLELLFDARRESYLPDIGREFLALNDDDEGVLRGFVISAVPLTPDEHRTIEGRLTAKWGKKVILREKLDSTLVGGCYLKIKDQVIDGSVTGELRRVKQFLQG